MQNHLGNRRLNFKIKNILSNIKMIMSSNPLKSHVLGTYSHFSALIEKLPGTSKAVDSEPWTQMIENSG